MKKDFYIGDFVVLKDNPYNYYRVEAITNEAEVSIKSFTDYTTLPLNVKKKDLKKIKIRPFTKKELRKMLPITVYHKRLPKIYDVINVYKSGFVCLFDKESGISNISLKRLFDDYTTTNGIEHDCICGAIKIKN